MSKKNILNINSQEQQGESGGGGGGDQEDRKEVDVLKVGSAENSLISSSINSEEDIEARLLRLVEIKKEHLSTKYVTNYKKGSALEKAQQAKEEAQRKLREEQARLLRNKAKQDGKGAGADYDMAKGNAMKRAGIRKGTQGELIEEEKGENELEEEKKDNKKDKNDNLIDDYDNDKVEETKEEGGELKSKLLEYDLFYKELFFKNEVFKFDPKFKDKEEEEIAKEIHKMNLKKELKEAIRLRDIEAMKGRNTAEFDKKVKELENERFKMKNLKELKVELSMNNTEGFLAKGILLHNYFNETNNPIIPVYTIENERDVKGKEIIDFKDVATEEMVRRFYDECPCFKQRKACYKCQMYAKYYCGYLVDNFIFDNFSLLVIILNTIFILISDPRDDNAISNTSDQYFLYFYTVECILKILGFGFLMTERAYIKDSWNILDFVVILVGWVSMILENVMNGTKISGLAALRAFRILRPLKTVKSIKGLRRLIIALLGSLAKLKDITIVLVFFFLLFAIGGVQMWQGNFLRRCMSVNYGYMYSLTGLEAMCTFDSDCNEYDEPGNTFICSKGWRNPNNGANSFDDTLIGFVTVFVVATMEGWSDIFEFVSLTFKDKIYVNPIINFLFFHFFIFACGFYLMNLFLAVTNTEFTNIERVRRELMQRKSLYELLKSNYDLNEKIKEEKKIREKEESKKKNKKLGENIYDLKERIQEDAFYIKKNLKDVPKTYTTIKDIYILSGNSPQELYQIDQAIDREQDYLYDDIDRQMKEVDDMARNQEEERDDEENEKLMEEEEIKKIEAKTNHVIMNYCNKEAYAQCAENMKGFMQEEMTKLAKKEQKKIKIGDKADNTNEHLKKKIEEREMAKFAETQVSMREDLSFEETNKDEEHQKETKKEKEKAEEERLKEEKEKKEKEEKEKEKEKENENENEEKEKEDEEKEQKSSESEDDEHKHDSLINHELAFIDDLSLSQSSADSTGDKKKKKEAANNSDLMEDDFNMDHIPEDDLFIKNDPNNSMLEKKVIRHGGVVMSEKTGNILNFHRPECSLPTLINFKNDEKFKKKNKILMANFDIDNYIEGMDNKDHIKKNLNRRKSYLKFLKYGNVNSKYSDLFAEYEKSKQAEDEQNEEEEEREKENDSENESKNDSKNDNEENENDNENKNEKGNKKEIGKKGKKVQDEEAKEEEERKKELLEKNKKKLYHDECSILSKSIRSIKTINSENYITKNFDNNIYDEEINMEQVKKKEQLNKVTSYAKKIFLDKNSKNSAANMNSNKMKKFYEKVNRQINENLIIDMKEPRGRNADKTDVSHVYIEKEYEFNNEEGDFVSLGEKSDSKKKLTIRNLLDNKVNRNYSITLKAKDGQNNNNEDEKLKKEDRSEGVFKTPSVEKNIMKYPKFDTMKNLVQEENKKMSNTLTAKQEEITDNWRTRRFYMNYLNNIKEKEIKVKDNFKINAWRQEILGQEENIIKREKLPESSEAEFVFNERSLNLKRYKFLYNRLQDFEDDELAYITNELKNLPFSVLEIMPIRMRDFGKYYVGKEINLGVLSATTSNKSGTSTNIGATNYSASASNMRSRSNFCSASSFGIGKRLKEDYKSKKLVYDKFYKSLDGFNYNTLSHYFMDEERLYFKFTDAKHKEDRKKELEEEVKQKEAQIEVKSEVKNVKLFDIKSNSVRYVHWSGQDILYEKDTNSDENRDKYNDMIASEENFRVIIWLRAPGVKQMQKIKFGLYQLSIAMWFDLLIMGIVVANAVVMALDGNLFTPEDYNDISISNYVFNGIFIAEFVFKIIGLGPVVYFSDAFTYLDLVIIIFAIFDMVTSDDTVDTIGSKKSLTSQLTFLRVFRIFRVLRLTKILRRMKSMRLIIVSIKKCLAEVSYIVVILLMFTIIFQLLGMSLLNGNARYQSFLIAFYTTFQILTKEGWNTIFYEVFPLSKWCFFYYLIWIFLGNYVLFNLFISILLQSFSSNDNDEQDDLDDGEILDLQFHLPDYLVKMREFEKNQREKGQALRIKRSANSDKLELDSVSASSSRIKTSQSALSENSENVSSSSMAIDDKDKDDNELITKNDSGVEKNMRQWKKVDELFKRNECETAFYFISQVNPVRVWCMAFSTSFGFETFIMILILISTLKLILDTIVTGYVFVWTFDIVDFVFNMVFLFEMIVKVIGLGLILDEGSYLRDHWNKIDFIIVVVSLIDLKSLTDKYIKGNSSSSSSLNFIKVLRLLRTLRTLRIISHNVQLKCIISSLFDSIGPICYALFIVVIVYFMFSIVGINLFYNLFHNCYVPGVDTTFKTADGKFSDYLMQYDIEDQMPAIQLFCKERYNGIMDATPKFEFSNILTSLVTSYVLSTKEGWPEIMAEYRIYNEFYGIYFIVYVIAVSYFFINIFTGIMFRYFNEAYSREQKISNEDKKAAKYYDFINQILDADPEFAIYQQPKPGTLKYYLVCVANSKFLDNFIMIIIFLNMIVMAINYDGTTDTYQTLLDKLNLIFTSIFIGECVLKLCALGPYCYFYVGWNDFDFFVVVASIVDLIVANMDNINASFLKSFQIIRVLRVLRITRVLRLIKSLKSLEKLIQTLRWSIEALANIAMLMLLLFLIFSILGCYLYDAIIYDEYKDDLLYLDTYYNFDNFYKSFLLMFRCSTGEKWSSFMLELCFVDLDVVTEAQGYAFMIIVNFFSAIIMLNLFLMITLQQYDEFTSKSYNPVEMFETFMENFKVVWNKLSTASDNGRRIHKNYLTDFFMEFQWKKLNFPDDNKLIFVKKYISELKVRVDPEEYVYFHDVLYKLVVAQLGAKIDRSLASNSKLLKVEKKIGEQVKKRVNGYIDSIIFKMKLRDNNAAKNTKNLYNNVFNPQTSHFYYKCSYMYTKAYVNFYKEFVHGEERKKEEENEKNRNAKLGGGSPKMKDKKGKK